jgi:hypothetical protein
MTSHLLLVIGHRAMWLNIPGLAVVLTVCCLCGAVCYAEYRNCDPLTSGLITASDQVSIFITTPPPFPSLLSNSKITTYESH